MRCGRSDTKNLLEAWVIRSERPVPRERGRRGWVQNGGLELDSAWVLARADGHRPTTSALRVVTASRVWSAPASERGAVELADRGEQFGLLEQPLFVALDHPLAGAIAANHAVLCACNNQGDRQPIHYALVAAVMT